MPEYLHRRTQEEDTEQRGPYKVNPPILPDYIIENLQKDEKAAAKKEATKAAKKDETVSEVTITWGDNANQNAVPQQALEVLKAIAREAKVNAFEITSTLRTPEDQARAMYNNIVSKGVKSQYKLYSAGGDQVIDVYVAKLKEKANASQIKAAMAQKIKDVGPSSVSKHCADPTVLTVVDIGPSSVEASKKKAFIAAVNAAHTAGIVSKFLHPGNSDDPAYHIEIPVTQQEGSATTSTKTTPPAATPAPKAKEEAKDKTVEATKNEKTAQKELPTDIETYLAAYEKKAEKYLNFYYTTTFKKYPKENRITADLFKNAAREIYEQKKDVNYIIPVEFAIAQLISEGGINGKERTAGNVFNYAAYDKGKSALEKKIDTREKGFRAYYNLMAENYLQTKTANQLLEHGGFTNASGKVYATNPHYEVLIKAQIAAMHTEASYGLKDKVGEGQKNNPEDVLLIGNMLTKLGYLKKEDTADTAKVIAALKDFQDKELAPSESDWYKKRMKAVTNKTDQKNMARQKDMLTDGMASPKGYTIAVLYYMTALENKIPGVNDAGRTAKKAEPLKLTFAEEGFSVGLPSKKYAEILINYTRDVKKVQDKLKEIGLLSVEDYTNEYPEAHADINKNAKNITTPDVDAEMPQTDASHVWTDFETNAMKIYGKVPKGEKVSASSLAKTIEAIKIFQKEVKRGTADGRIDPNGGTLTLLMNANKETVAKARAKYAADMKAAAEAKKKQAAAKAASTKKATPKASSQKGDLFGDLKQKALTAMQISEQVQTLYTKYKEEKIDMIALGKGLIPYASKNGWAVLGILDEIGWQQRDNLCFVIATHSTDAQLASYDKALLLKMQDELSGWFNTTSWRMHAGQKARVDAALEKPNTINNEILLKQNNSNNNNIEIYLNIYQKKAETFLSYFYSTRFKRIPKEKRLTADLFVDAAKYVYEQKKDTKYIIPVEFAIAQLVSEGGINGNERTAGNVFNVGAYDSGKSALELSINNRQKGFRAYYDLMAQKYLEKKNADELLEKGGFTNSSGYAYATNPHYEVLSKAHIAEMYTKGSFGMKDSVGESKKNNPEDVLLIGNMLAQLGYITQKDTQDTVKVITALKRFQYNELAPTEENWYKKRMKGVITKGDQENMREQKRILTDGVADPKGYTVAILYYMTVLNNKIPQ